MVEQSDPDELKQAFRHFNEISGDLIASYNALQEQVSSLTAELARAKQQQAAEVHSREQLSEKYIDLLRLLPAGVIVLDKWGVVVEANPFAKALLGVELLGRKWFEVIGDCFAPQNDDGHEVSLKNGKRVKLETRALVAEPGQILLLTDQSATRDLQEKLSQNERLMAIGKMSSALAHQIRTPLSAALLHAANLRDMPLSPEQSQRFAGKVCDNLQHLESQVRDMLIFSRANIPLEDRISIKELLDIVCQQAQARFKKTRVLLHSSLRVDGVDEADIAAQQTAASQTVLLCNKAVFVGALNNLLANALEASTIGDTVSLSFSVTGSRLDISVRDEGSGIEPTVLERINAGEAFVTSKDQGTGLGLTVVRAVVAAHKGKMQVTSSVNEGTRVSIQSITVQHDNREQQAHSAARMEVSKTVLS